MSSNVMITLDSIMDTRLGVVGDLSMQAIPNILPLYHTRREDAFDVMSKGIIDINEYNARYKNRDVDILKQSYRTGIIEVVNSLVEGLNSGPWESTVITVNMYPYKLSKLEISAILEALSIYIPNVEFKSNSISNELLTVDMLGEWECYIAYDLLDWIESQGDSISGKRITTTCYYPRLLRRDAEFKDSNGNDLEPSEIEKIKERDPWDSLEVLYSTHITLKGIPARFFSIMPESQEHA